MSDTHGERVKASILATGLELWRVDPAWVTSRRIGRKLQMTHAGVLYHFGDWAALRAAIACEAVRTGDPVIVPQLITTHDPAAGALSDADRRRFLGAV